MKILENQLADFEWFNENKANLVKKYGNCFIVIKNKTVIGTYKTFAEAVQQTEKTEEIGTFIVQECTLNPDGNTNTIVSVGLMV
mgnify:CR=1 FL=1